jgi:hypothetical protein
MNDEDQKNFSIRRQCRKSKDIRCLRQIEKLKLSVITREPNFGLIKVERSALY